MGRITKAQRAGLDFLDQIYFNQLVVFRGMNIEELDQLGTIILRVKQMTESKYSGSQAEIVKHLSYYFLELAVTKMPEELGSAIPVDESLLPKIDSQVLEKVRKFTMDFQRAFMLVLIEKITGFKADYALEICHSLKNELMKCSALVGRDLVMRCFAYEHLHAPVQVYCWLISSGVLPVQKNDSERVRKNLKDTLEIRIILLANQEMILNYFKMTISQWNPASLYLEKFNLSEEVVDQLLDMHSVFNDSRYKADLRSVPLLRLTDFADSLKIKNFFNQLGVRNVRLRMQTGTLASWLGFLGAGLVEFLVLFHCLEAIDEKNIDDFEGVKISDLRIPAVFNATDNQNAITEKVKKNLFRYGLIIHADTLYRSYKKMHNTFLPLLIKYCEMTRGVGVVTSALYGDLFYIAVFIHSGKVSIKESPAGQ